MTDHAQNKKDAKKIVEKLLTHYCIENAAKWRPWMVAYKDMAKQDDRADALLEAMEHLAKLLTANPDHEEITVIVVDVGLRNCAPICLKGKYYPGSDRIDFTILYWKLVDLRKNKNKPCKATTTQQYNDITRDFFIKLVTVNELANVPIDFVGVEQQMRHCNFTKKCQAVGDTIVTIFQTNIIPL
jgi:hypothetical protein